VVCCGRGRGLGPRCDVSRVSFLAAHIAGYGRSVWLARPSYGLWFPGSVEDVRAGVVHAEDDSE
jgi:hypothetical protein